MLELNKIYLGNCFELMKRIDDKSIDMILADLPFSKTDFYWDKSFNLEILWNSYRRIIKNNGCIALNAIQPFTTDLINSNKKWFKYDYVWIKTQAANFQLAKYMPLKKHESILIFYNKKPIYNPQMWKGKLKSKRIGHIKYQDRKKEMYLSSKPANLSIVKNDIYYPTTILTFSSCARNKSLHPTQKPVELCEFFIKTYTNKNDLILDNVTGSGTTLLAAKNLNRQFIGIEKEEKYYKIACTRIGQIINL